MNSEKLIFKILTIIDPVLKRREKTSISFPLEFTFFHVLERVKCNLDAIKLLQVNGVGKYDHAIGLLSRNLLSDFITTGYVIKKSENEEDIYMKLYSLHNSDIKKLGAYFTVMNKAKVITDEDVHQIKNKMSDNPIYTLILDYCKDNDVKNFPVTASIISLFSDSNPKDQWANEIKNSYDTWVYYSKYEHVGRLSYELTRGTTNEKADKRLKGVLVKTLILAASCLDILKEEEAMSECLKLLPGFKDV